MNTNPTPSDGRADAPRPCDSTRFPKRLRLLNSRQFQAVYHSRQYAADATLVVNAAANKCGICRLGLAVSRKVGNAVVRNRWKRAIREAFRMNRHRLPEEVDLVVRPRAGAKYEFQQIQHSLVALAWRAAGRSAKESGRTQRRRSRESGGAG